MITSYIYRGLNVTSLIYMNLYYHIVTYGSEGVKGGPFGPISKNVTEKRGANDALIVIFYRTNPIGTYINLH